MALYKYDLQYFREYSESRGYILLSNEYLGTTANMDFYCTFCENKFSISFHSLKDNGAGCSFCASKKRIDSRKNSIISKNGSLSDNFPNVANEWSVLNENSPDSYCQTSGISVWWVCPNGHEDYKSTISGRTSRGYGCPKCKPSKISKTRRDNARGLGNTVYDIYPEIVCEWSEINEKSPQDYAYGSHAKIWWICKKHGNYLATIKERTIVGTGCPACSASRGEQKVEKILSEFGYVHGIDYFREYKFKDCKLTRPLPFDFYLPNINCVIEIDGEHHRKPVCYGGISESDAVENFKIQKKKDKIKDRYCKLNKIKMIRIEYDGKNPEKNIYKKISLLLS